MLVLLVFGLIFSFSGCSKDESAPKKADPVVEAVEKSPVEDLTGRLPDNVVGFVASSGGDSLKDSFEKTLLGQFCNDPEVKLFYEEIKGAVSAIAENEMDPGEKQIIYKILGLVARTSHRPFAIGIAGKEAKESLVPAYGFLVIDAGEQKEEFAYAVKSLEALSDDGEIVDVSVGQYTMHWPKDSNDVPGYWGWVGQYFVLAINDDSGLTFKNLLAGGKVDYAAKLDKVSGHGDVMTVYLDCQKAGSLAKKYVPEVGGIHELRMVQYALDELGLSSIEMISSRMDFQGPDMVYESFIEMPGDKGGLVSCIKPIDPAMLDIVDSRAVGAHVSNIDIADVYDVILNAVHVVGGDDVYQVVTSQVDSIQEQLRINIRDGLLASLGGQTVMYAMPMGLDGMTFGGYVIITDLKDAELFEATMEELAVFGLRISQGLFQPSSVEIDGRTIHFWTIAPLAMAQVIPTWTIVDDKLIMASNSQMCNIAVAQIESSDMGKTSIRSTATYKQIAGKLPKNLTNLSYIDTKTLIRQLLTQFQQYWPKCVKYFADEMDMQLSMKIPDAEGVISKIAPTVSYSWIDDAGLHSRGQGPVLVKGPAVILGGALGMAALWSVERQSDVVVVRSQREHSCMYQLRSICIGCIMYATENEGKMPTDFEMIAEYLGENDVFVCPGSDDESGHNSYVYRGADLDITKLAEHSRIIIAYDKEGNHRGVYRNVAFLDGHVEKISEEQFADVINDDNELRMEAGLEEKVFE